MIDEGYIKYHAQWQMGPAPLGIEALVAVRNELYALGFIGEYVDSKIGFGNVSMRSGSGGAFAISGSATGHVSIATPEHFCLVDAYDIRANSVSCIGPVIASSESMTHAMLYACSADIGAVLHIHHMAFWTWLLSNAPSSAVDVPYGTPEMALEMARLFSSTDLPHRRILAMAGHSEGIVAFGRDVGEAMEKILKEFAKLI
jgi:hypothetical protein